MNDIRHAIRLWTKSPGFSLTAVLTMAIGIGASTEMRGYSTHPLDANTYTALCPEDGVRISAPFRHELQRRCRVTGDRATAASFTQALAQKANTMRIQIDVDGTRLTATLDDNATTRDFISLLPLTLTLEDYNGTEKISNRPKRLSTKDAPAGVDPSIGDITYYSPWGNLAIFYKDFRYSSGLVKLGRIDSHLGSRSRGNAACPHRTRRTVSRLMPSRGSATSPTPVAEFPDARIEYDIDGRDHTLDLEVMTPHY
jgi:hypothetical protein